MQKEISRTFIYTKIFTRKWYDYGLSEEDLRQMEVAILKDPKKPPMIEGTGGIRKLRWAIEGRGKSGSIRVCYCDFEIYGVTYCVLVFAKKEQANLTKAEKAVLKKLVAEAKANLKERGTL